MSLILAPSGRPASAELAVFQSIATGRARNNAVDPYGTPNFDPNRVVTPRERRGSASLPGIYDEMLCYPVIARAVQAIEEAAVATEWRLTWPKGFIPTPADDEFMALCRRWMIERPVVIPGMDVDGLDNLIPYMLMQEWYGFGLFVPAFSDADAASADVHWYPTRASAITKWNPNIETGGYVSALFATSLGSTELKFDEFVHVGRRVMPGEMEGVSRLRPLIVPFENVKQLLLDAGIYDTMRNGWLDVAYGPGSEGPADQARLVQGVAMVQAGAARAVMHKDTEKWSMQFPAGTPPDVVGRIELYERQMRELLDQSLGSVGDKGGSLALGAAAQQVDEARTARWIARAVNQSARAMMLYLARRLGCIGSLRLVPTMEPVATESAASIEQVQAYLTSVQSGVIRTASEDQAWVRAAIGAPSPDVLPDDAGAGAAEALQPLPLPALQAAVTIMTAPGLAPVSMRILLVAAGLDPAKASEAVLAQASQPRPTPVPPDGSPPGGGGGGAPLPAAPAPVVRAGAAVGQGVTSGALVPSAGDVRRAEVAELAADVPDYAVPEDVREACRRALAAHAETPANRRSTDVVALQVARDLSAGRRIRWSRVLALLGWMERDAVRAKRGGADLDTDEGRVAQAYRLRGGASAVRWLRDVYRRHGEGVTLRSVRLAADDVDTAPTDGMVEEAERGLAWRREHGRGGTAVGVARARDIAGRRNLSPDTVRRMASYFARHAVDKRGAGWSPGEDGYPSAGRIAWALWGGDAGESWASKVTGQLDRSAKLAAADAGEIEVVGADGEPFLLYRPLRPEEAAVEWVTLAGERDDADEALADDMAQVADEQRAATWEASADGWQPGEADAVRARFEKRYREVIERYTARVSETARAAAIAEARRMLDAGAVVEVSTPAAVEALEAADAAATATAAKKATAVELQTDLAAKAAAQRVQGEVGQAVIAGATEETFVPRITPEGLAKDARAAGTQAEAAARLDAATDPEVSDLGLMPYSVIRTSIPDRARCRHCREMDTGKEVVLADVEVSPGVYAIPELPDPECEGAPNCRCGYLVTYRVQAEPATGGEGKRRAA
jgi:hypothetical protein